MSCSAHDTCQLYFPIPFNGKEQDFIIYFYPDNNEQRQVIRCESFQDKYHCVKETGFGWDKLNSTHALITVPTHVAAESGNFFSHVQGQDEPGSWKCSWSPVDSCFPPNLRIRSEPDYSTTPLGINTLSPQSENDEKKDNDALYIGVFPGLSLILIAMILIGAIMLFKKRKSTKGAQHSKTEKMMEKGQENDSVISGGKKCPVDEYTNKISGMGPVQLSAELQNLLKEFPTEKKVSDFSDSPRESTGTTIRIADYSSEAVDQVKPTHLLVEEWDFERPLSLSSESDSSTRSNESNKPLLQNR